MQLKQELEGGGVAFTDAEGELLFNAFDSEKGDGKIDASELKIQESGSEMDIDKLTDNFLYMHNKAKTLPKGLHV